MIENKIKIFDLKYNRCLFLDHKLSNRKISQVECNVCNLYRYIQKDWLLYLQTEIDKPYFKEIIKFLHAPKKILPPINKIFSFTQYSTLENTKIVILGQDPYHIKGQAMGLSFSVNKESLIPKSLQNIFKEIKYNYQSEFNIPSHGCLIDWAKQGVLLLNCVLTVFENEPNSHKKIGWQNLIYHIIKLVNDKCDNVVFMIWGKNSEKIIKDKLVDHEKHLILRTSHPRSFGSKSEFFGCMHFRKANEYLIRKNIKPIKW